MLSKEDLHESPDHSSSQLSDSLLLDDVPVHQIDHPPRSNPTTPISSPSLPTDRPDTVGCCAVVGDRRNRTPQHDESQQHRPTNYCFRCASIDSNGSVPRRRRNGRNAGLKDIHGTLPIRKSPLGPDDGRYWSVIGHQHGDKFPTHEKTDLHEEEEEEKEEENHFCNGMDPGRTMDTRMGSNRFGQYHPEGYDSDEQTNCSYTHRSRNIESNHLCKSTATGLEALALAELARSVSTLRYDMERLTAQHHSLLAASRADLQGNEENSGDNFDYSSGPIPSITTSSRERITGKTGTPSGHASQGIAISLQESNDVRGEMEGECGPSLEKFQTANPTDAPKILEFKQSAWEHKPGPTAPQTVPEIIKPAEKLFIGSDSPKVEGFRRAGDRPKARRITDQSKYPKTATPTKMTVKETEEVSPMNEKSQYLPVDRVPSADQEINENESASSGGLGSRISTTARPASSRPRNLMTPRNTTSTLGRTSRSTSSSYRRTIVPSSASSIMAKHQRTGTSLASRVNSTNENRTKPQQSASKQHTGQLSNEPRLSSLRRLETSGEGFHTAPGLPLAGVSPQTRLYVKPKTKSNRQVIVNAISHCCLAGPVNESSKSTTLQELAATDGTHFIILFRDNRCQYRALYVFDFDTEELKFICGSGPRRITHNMCCNFFKYNSGAKQFGEITSTKHLSAVVDAITIKKSCWIRGPSKANDVAPTSSQEIKS